MSKGVWYPLFDIPLLKFCSSPSKFAVNYHHETNEKGGSQTTDTVSKPKLLNRDSYQGRKKNNLRVSFFFFFCHAINLQVAHINEKNEKYDKTNTNKTQNLLKVIFRWSSTNICSIAPIMLLIVVSWFLTLTSIIYDSKEIVRFKYQS